MAESGGGAVSRKINVIFRTKGLKEMRAGLSKTTQEMKKATDGTGKWSKKTEKAETKTKKWWMSFKKFFTGLRGFRMEMLSVMFFGMAIQKLFKGLVQPALQLSGAMQLLSSVLAIMFLPLALKMIDFAIWLLEKWNALSEGQKNLINWLVAGAIAFGTLLQVFGAVVLGIGGMLVAFGGLIGWIISLAFWGAIIIGVWALLGSIFPSVAASTSDLTGKITEQVPWIQKVIDKIKEWKNMLTESAAWQTATETIGGIWDSIKERWESSYLYAWVTFQILKIKTKWANFLKWWKGDGSEGITDGWKKVTDWWETSGKDGFNAFLDFFKEDLFPFFKDTWVPFLKDSLFPVFRSFIELLAKLPADVLKIVIGAMIGGKMGGGYGAIAGGVTAALLPSVYQQPRDGNEDLFPIRPGESPILGSNIQINLQIDGQEFTSFISDTFVNESEFNGTNPYNQTG